MKLRWHVVRNKVTVQTIKDYQEIHGCGIYQAKNALINQTKTLQYFDEEGDEWVDIPTVVTEIEPDLNIRP